MSNTQLQKPPLFLFLTEVFRAWYERLSSIKFRQKADQFQVGDDHPVLVIPGLLGNDKSTKPLRNFVEKCNYTSYGWELGTNLANLDDLQNLSKQLQNIYKKHNQKISLIGWSLGGIYARKLAKDHPHMVRQIITLGSPFCKVDAPSYGMWTVKILNRSREFIIPEEHREWVSALPDPMPIPTTSIFTKEDGVVPWQICKEAYEDDIHQNIEISGSHMGLVANKQALAIIANRLPYSKDNWVKYSV